MVARPEDDVRRSRPGCVDVERGRGGAERGAYTIGRTYLFDLLLREMQNDKVRILDGANSQRAYEQLMNLEKEIGQSGIIYRCLARHHDDLAISCAMVVWAAQHLHLPRWCWPFGAAGCSQRSSRAKCSRLDLTVVWCPVPDYLAVP